MKRRILIVDDQVNTLKVIGAILRDEGHEIFTGKSASEALRIFEEKGNIDAVLADLKMPGESGLDLYREIRATERNTPFIIMTAHGTIESAVRAMKEGVTNYLIKPINYEELSLVLERAIREKEVTRELANLRKEIKEQYSFHNIIGTSKKMRRIFDMLRTVAPTDAPVLILGETGTGKELLAKAIHALSQRQDRNMVCINSAALTETLLEAELFGYVKGAFTGAMTNKKGRFESADRGTLFLDEIGQMSLKIQSKLLRFLQEGTFEPVGSVETRKVDVRVISASNRNLEDQIKAERFLSDLFYRIEVISITLPPLRKRIEDIPLLANHFIKRYTRQYEKNVEGISAQAVEGLMKHHWPGNVRELENCLARAVILCGKSRIELEDFSKRIRSLQHRTDEKASKSFIREIPEKGLKVRDMERELIIKTLEKCRGNKSLSAEFLGISRKALYEKLERYGLPI
jgi:DNA-binding NtrC family response regulator